MTERGGLWKAAFERNSYFRVARHFLAIIVVALCTLIGLFAVEALTQ
jgi:hypothetical protein